MCGLSPQALPWRATSSELAADTQSGQITLVGTTSVVGIMSMALLNDESVRAAVVRDVSLDAALQRIRCGLPVHVMPSNGRQVTSSVQDSV